MIIRANFSSQCWPEAIVPDPGYALLTDDKWYQTAGAQNFDIQLYGKKDHVIDDKELDAADEWMKKHNFPVPDRPKAKKRALDEVLGDGFLVQEANVTRRLTEREIEEDLQIIQCSDRTCSKERRDVNDVVIPGGIHFQERSVPRLNRDVIPTPVPRITSSFVIERRTLLTSQLPEATLVGT